ncbi:hypothetical protein B5X24_HaOG215940 [Helicoverpa armigera]|nr:hypothetical protein B5X24_HaOG215940 [Helicoverpa armigera]
MIGGFQNEPIYIARAEHIRSVNPGKFVPSAGRAFIPWGGREHSTSRFEILCGYNAMWVKTRNNQIPHNAFIGGSEVMNRPVYISRAKVNGNLICGKAFAHHAYLPYRGKEIKIDSYEILVLPDDEIPQALPFCDK